jgi:peptidoglycan-associated lipoprotein
MQYASVAGEEYLQGDRIETNLDDKVFFDFDRSSLDAEDKNLLEQYLPAIKNAKIVRLEGHCDERGTREYNLALGERRALEVRDFLIVKGISGKKIKVVSFGEEKPIKSASNEKAWTENRRVEISLY